MADGTRGRNRPTNNPPPATDPPPATGCRGGARGGAQGGNRGDNRGGRGGNAPPRDASPTALQLAQRLERERLAEEARVAQEVREEAVRRQQEEAARTNTGLSQRDLGYLSKLACSPMGLRLHSLHHDGQF